MLNNRADCGKPKSEKSRQTSKCKIIMKNGFKLMAMLFGAAAVATGFGSCDKGDDSVECCTLTETYESYTYKIKACEDGDVTVTYDGETETFDWQDEGDYTWSEIKEEMKAEGAKCS